MPTYFGRIGISALSLEYKDNSQPDEILIDKATSCFFYRNKDNELVSSQQADRVHLGKTRIFNRLDSILTKYRASIDYTPVDQVKNTGVENLVAQYTDGIELPYSFNDIGNEYNTKQCVLLVSFDIMSYAAELSFNYDVLADGIGTNAEMTIVVGDAGNTTYDKTYTVKYDDSGYATGGIMYGLIPLNKFATFASDNKVIVKSIILKNDRTATETQYCNGVFFTTIDRGDI